MKDNRAKKTGWLKVCPGNLEAFILGGAILGAGGGGFFPGLRGL